MLIILDKRVKTNNTSVLIKVGLTCRIKGKVPGNFIQFGTFILSQSVQQHNRSAYPNWEELLQNFNYKIVLSTKSHVLDNPSHLHSKFTSGLRIFQIGFNGIKIESNNYAAFLVDVAKIKIKTNVIKGRKT
jgi:hypothetical protein